MLSAVLAEIAVNSPGLMGVLWAIWLIITGLAAVIWVVRALR